jgi:cytochrome c oxidase subunit 4
MTDNSEHIDSARTYILVFLALISLTALTTAVSFVNLGDFSVVAALAIAVCKMLLVALFFMHVRHSNKLTKLVLAGAMVWLGILIVLTLTDFATRGLAGVPGR